MNQQKIIKCKGQLSIIYPILDKHQFPDILSVLCVSQNTVILLWESSYRCSWTSCKSLMLLNDAVSYTVLKIRFHLLFFFWLHLSVFSFSFDWQCRYVPEPCMFVLMTRERLYRQFSEHSKYRWQDFILLDHLTFQRFERDWPSTE